MGFTLYDQQHRDELKVDVYGNGIFLISYLPSKLSKPMLKKVMKQAESENWEDQADSSTSFMAGLLSGWNLEDYKKDPETGEPIFDEKGKTIPTGVLPITPENIELLGFTGIRDITRAINNHYGEYMKEGEDKGSISEGISAGSKNTLRLIGTPSSEHQIEETQ